MSDELIERVCKAMADIGPGESLAWEFYVDEARAAIAIVRAAVIEECAREAHEAWMDGEPIEHIPALIRALAKGDEP